MHAPLRPAVKPTTAGPAGGRAGASHRNPVTPFADVTGYFPAPVAALRTCKSDVAVGVPPGRLAHLEATAPGWRTDGTHAVIHVRP